MTETTGTMDASSMAHASAHEASSPIVGTLFGLTFVTGVIDAVSFLGLGHVFTANMTGNVVLLGFALGGNGDLSAVRSLDGAGCLRKRRCYWWPFDKRTPAKSGRAPREGAVC